MNVGIVKWLIGTNGLTLVTFFINWGFKNRTVGTDEFQQYDKYVTNLIILNNPRRLPAQYFANVTPSETLRERWEAYFARVDKEYQQTLMLDSLTKKKIDYISLIYTVSIV